MSDHSRARKCHCGKSIKKDIGNYPLEGYSEKAFASPVVYTCEDGHKQHVPRYEMKNDCPNCGKSKWNFSFVGNANSKHECQACGFQVIQSGLLHLWESGKPPASTGICILCNADALIIHRDGYDYLYGLEKNESLDNLKMNYEWLQCLSCSASYFRHKCPYCGSWKVARSEKRERQIGGRDYGHWQNLCHCHDCQNEWYVGAGWSD